MKDIKTLSIENRDACDLPITVNDIKDSINKLKPNKAPGTDGLTAAYYKKFSNELAPFCFSSIALFKSQFLLLSLILLLYCTFKKHLLTFFLYHLDPSLRGTERLLCVAGIKVV